MITNNAGTTVTLNQNTTYSSVTGLWTLVSPHTLFNSGLLNFGRPLVGKMVKSSSASLLPSGSADLAIYYIFKVGNTIGLAATLEDASNNVPVKFYTSGELFSFVQAGNTYRLPSLYKPCCADELFNAQLPNSSTLGILYRMPLPNKLPKKIALTISGIVKPGQYVGQEGARLTRLANIVNGDWDLYHGASNAGAAGSYYFKDDGAGQAVCSTYPIVFYDNIKITLTGIEHTSCFVYFQIVISSTNVVYQLNISAATSINTNSAYFCNLQYTAEISLPLDGLNISNSIFANVPTLVLTSSSTLLTNIPATITIALEGDYNSELSPETLTLIKLPGPPPNHTHLKNHNAPYPVRGFTTNNYSDALPDTIVLNKVDGFDSVYESDIFITAINVSNKIRLKLAVFPNGFMNFAFYGNNIYDIYKENNFVSSFGYLENGGGMQFMNDDVVLVYDGELIKKQPAFFTEGATTVMLFFMAGTPIETDNTLYSACYAIARYRYQI